MCLSLLSLCRGGHESIKQILIFRQIYNTNPSRIVRSILSIFATHPPWQAAREEPLKPYGDDTPEQYDISLKHGEMCLHNVDTLIQEPVSIGNQICTDGVRPNNRHDFILRKGFVEIEEKSKNNPLRCTGLVK